MLIFNFIHFSIAVLSVFSEIHYRDKQKNRKRQRSPADDNIMTEAEPVPLEIGKQIEVILSDHINY